VKKLAVEQEKVPRKEKTEKGNNERPYGEKSLKIKSER